MGRGVGRARRGDGALSTALVQRRWFNGAGSTAPPLERLPVGGRGCPSGGRGCPSGKRGARIAPGGNPARGGASPTVDGFGLGSVFVRFALEPLFWTTRLRDLTSPWPGHGRATAIGSSPTGITARTRPGEAPGLVKPARSGPRPNRARSSPTRPSPPNRQPPPSPSSSDSKLRIPRITATQGGRCATDASRNRASRART